MTLVKLESQSDVAILRLDNGVINSINSRLLSNLSETLSEIRNQCRGVVLTGGEKFFSLGFDLPELLNFNRNEMMDFFWKFNETVLELFTIPRPTACAIKGHAIAGGTILLLSCDYRLAVPEKVSIGLNEIKLGVPTPYLADLILRQVTGDHIASQIIYEGEFMNSTEALKKDVLTEVVSREEVEHRAFERVIKISGFNTRAFSESKANRCQNIESAYRSGHMIKNEAFIDCWFNPVTQDTLREAARKSFSRQ